jgi:hypothetical protein
MFAYNYHTGGRISIWAAAQWTEQVGVRWPGGGAMKMLLLSQRSSPGSSALLQATKNLVTRVTTGIKVH